MGLFYAYLKDARDDVYYRYLITFVNREAADEWWRMISTSPSPYVSTVKRISPQFYVQFTSQIDVVTTFFSSTALLDAKLFYEKMFFTSICENSGKQLSIIPPTEVTDHISGRWYFIQAKADLRKYWYFRISGQCLVCGSEDCEIVHVSTKYRSRFRIQVHNLACKDFQAPKDLVVIGRDEISITASKDYTLRINDDEDLVATKVYQIATANLLFQFDDFKSRFVSRTEKHENDEGIWEYVVPVEKGFGEAWELID